MLDMYANILLSRSLKAMGTDIHRIEPDVTGFPQAEAWMQICVLSSSRAGRYCRKRL